MLGTCMVRDTALLQPLALSLGGFALLFCVTNILPIPLLSPL
jgi:hypothetical protein